MLSIDFEIITDNDGLSNAFRAALPGIDDPRVNPYDYSVSPDGAVNEDGIKTLSGNIRFDLRSDRDAMLDNLVEGRGGLVGIINACEVGSFVGWHECNGDDAPCVLEDKVRKS